MPSALVEQIFRRAKAAYGVERDRIPVIAADAVADAVTKNAPRPQRIGGRLAAPSVF
ncbi:hypothetical protein [Amycolatopsis sp. lyj-109]|uniref:hypothetical protein n=1 Tax=Amycolatopsis sp. lyj-109 TaxID=2789287 RepID=UPI00397D116C